MRRIRPVNKDNIAIYGLSEICSDVCSLVFKRLWAGVHENLAALHRFKEGADKAVVWIGEAMLELAS